MTEMTIQDVFDAHTLALSAIGNGIKLGNDEATDKGYDLLYASIAAAKRLVVKVEKVNEVEEQVNPNLIPSLWSGTRPHFDL